MNIAVSPAQQQGPIWLKGIANELGGLLCMSSDWSHPLMWAHYADNHTGICLGFEFEVDGISWLKVDYVAKREYVDWDAYASDWTDPAPIRRLFATKFDAWQYEREFRLLCDIDSCVAVGNLLFKPFTKADLTLKEVIVGCRSNISQTQLTTALGQRAPTVRQSKAAPAATTFLMERERL